MRREHARGFTLLEAVVALAILAAAGMALFAAMTQSVQMVGRAESSREADAALRNALAYVGAVNPAEDPQGRQPLGAYELVWNAELLEPARPSATGYVAPGLHEVGLYRLDLELWRDGELQREASVRRIGYRQVRQPQVL